MRIARVQSVKGKGGRRNDDVMRYGYTVRGMLRCRTTDKTKLVTEPGTKSTASPPLSTTQELEIT